MRFAGNLVVVFLSLAMTASRTAAQTGCEYLVTCTTPGATCCNILGIIDLTCQTVTADTECGTATVGVCAPDLASLTL
ncbi:hypothetical protein DAEQUDRAFT_722983 [Daedalea quercina L-15889]|uniref:Hydrophobin n=1 Tax=Daedalea quercina L-15889 TaxID=1314783 RepID=A0A165SPN9_9APHY|nr:hypothetical protein DAEQUDRAFT_722983 [Daedalea quercina L-15889]